MSALTEYLEKKAGNKGLMATLRCGLVDTTEERAWPVLAMFGGIGRSHDALVTRTIAGLFANWHDFDKSFGKQCTIGNVCRQLCSETELAELTDPANAFALSATALAEDCTVPALSASLEALSLIVAAPSLAAFKPAERSENCPSPLCSCCAPVAR